MSMTPPIISALDFSFSPNTLPSLTPMKQQTKVIRPMIDTAGIILTLRKAKVTPMARASILVATASVSIVFTSIESFTTSQDFASFIIFMPMTPRSTKAIQWSMELTTFLNPLPSKKPISGISA